MDPSEYVPFVKRVIRSKFGNNPNIDQLESEGCLGLIFALKNYKPEGGSFSKFASACIVIQARTYLSTLKIRRKSDNVYKLIPTEGCGNSSYSLGDLPEEEVIKRLKRRCESNRSLHIEYKAAIEGKTTIDIGNDLNISKSRVSQIRARNNSINFRKFINILEEESAELAL